MKAPYDDVKIKPNSLDYACNKKAPSLPFSQNAPLVRYNQAPPPHPFPPSLRISQSACITGRCFQASPLPPHSFPNSLRMSQWPFADSPLQPPSIPIVSRALVAVSACDGRDPWASHPFQRYPQHLACHTTSKQADNRAHGTLLGWP